MQPMHSHRREFDVLNDFSLEMTAKDIHDLESARDLLPDDTRVNITFLATEDLGMRLSAVQRVKDLGLTPVAHIAARRMASHGEFKEYLAQLQQIGASEKVFCVGGDPTTPIGPYSDALSLIRSELLPSYGVQEVSIAGYPEGHPAIEDSALWEHLERKTAALNEQDIGQVVLTQFGFDAMPVVNWIRTARSRGISGDIRVGVPGPAGVKRLLSFARRFGVGSSAGIIKKYGMSLTNLVGTAGPNSLISDLNEILAAENLSSRVKTHFYTFGGIRSTAEWAATFTHYDSESAE